MPFITQDPPPTAQYFKVNSNCVHSSVTIVSQWYSFISVMLCVHYRSACEFLHKRVIGSIQQLSECRAVLDSFISVFSFRTMNFVQGSMCFTFSWAYLSLCHSSHHQPVLVNSGRHFGWPAPPLQGWSQVSSLTWLLTWSLAAPRNSTLVAPGEDPEAQSASFWVLLLCFWSWVTEDNSFNLWGLSELLFVKCLHDKLVR